MYCSETVTIAHVTIDHVTIDHVTYYSKKVITSAETILGFFVRSSDPILTSMLVIVIS